MEIMKPSLTSRSTTKTNKGVSKTAIHKTKIGKCQRPSGTIHRNPYLNFLSDFRQRNTGLSAVETIKRGAKEWMSMAKEDKLQYIEKAFYAPKIRKCCCSMPVEACGHKKKKVSICPSKKRRSRSSSCSSTKRSLRKKSSGCFGKRKSKRRTKKMKKHKCGQRKKLRKRRPRSQCKRRARKLRKIKKKRSQCSFF
ncbi:uncharacterized protein [Eurosta solidaginis]|uniref:uncharacterized protein n=1 Tax=Eurosta solidaginis TaxID=178769 RepID=UPI0035314EDA